MSLELDIDTILAALKNLQIVILASGRERSEFINLSRAQRGEAWSCLGHKYLSLSVCLSLSVGLSERSCLATRQRVNKTSINLARLLKG